MKVLTDLVAIFKSSVTSVIPDKIIRNSLKYNPSEQVLCILGETFDVKNKNVYMVGAGKAVEQMATEVENILGTKLCKGIISIPTGSKPATRTDKIQFFEGADNNLPDPKAEKTAKNINTLVSNLTKEDLLIVLISGGGSALLPLPKEPLSLTEKTKFVKALANSGADINELNIVRKKISNIKGGKLAIKAQPAKVLTMILSDIVGDPLDLIASGPTVENTDGQDDAIKIVRKYNLLNDLPASLINLLNHHDAVQTFPHENVKNYIIGSNKICLAEASNRAKDLGFMPEILSNAVTGNVVDVADKYIKITELVCKMLPQNKSNVAEILESLCVPGFDRNIFEDIKLTDKPICLIFGGETTVEVTGNGRGGRNQHLALEFSHRLDKVKNQLADFNVYILCAGTDGIDGPTDAAGAIGYDYLVSDAWKEKLDVEQYLSNNDSYSFYKQFKDGAFHVITGHTGTNVMDVHFIVIKRK